MIKIGALIESGKHYVGTVESGSFEDTFADSIRTRTISNIYTCLKSETKDVIDALVNYPTALLSDAGRNPDGTQADYINWGAGFSGAGNQVAEISPGFTRVTAKYIQDDPAGGVAVARSGSAAGGIVGKPWENGERFAETDQSGNISEDRVYDEDTSTWTRTRTISYIITCLRTDARTVADAIDLTPADLVTRGVSWGADYEVVNVYGQPISPSFYNITAKYRKTLSDPEAPAQITAYTGTTMIGKPWESGGIFTETPESGRLQDDRVYVASAYGWNRIRTVDKVMICLQCDILTVVNGIETAPNSLKTNENSGESIEWGRQYKLTGLSSSSLSPSMTQITAKYQGAFAEAIIVPPEDIDLPCNAGICSIIWKDALFETLDSGLPDLNYGIEVDYEGCTINMYCNGVKFDSFTAGGTPDDRILEWSISGDTAILKWCGEIWRQYDV